MNLKNLFSYFSKSASIRSTYNKNQTILNSAGKATWMKREYTEFAKEAYCKNVVAHRSISLIAKAASSITWQAENRLTNENYDSHPIITLINKPNSLTSGIEFFESLISYILIAGNSFCVITKNSQSKPIELHLLRPDRVSIITDEKAYPVAYRHKIGSLQEDYMIDNVTGKSDIIHFKNFHPLDDLYGLSPVEAAAYSIDQHNMAASWNQSLLQNGARPSGALIYKAESGNYPYLIEQQYESLREQIEENFSGHKNAGRPLILEGGLEWKEMSLSNKEMEFLEAKNSAAREIALAFGVPPQLLGIPGDNTYSNLQEARVALWEVTMLPLLDNITNQLNSFLAPYYNDNIRIIYNKDNISALSARRESLWQRIESCSFLTKNEKREIFGYSPLNGDNYN